MVAPVSKKLADKYFYKAVIRPTLLNMVIWVVEFPREGYKFRKFYG